MGSWVLFPRWGQKPLNTLHSLPAPPLHGQYLLALSTCKKTMIHSSADTALCQALIVAFSKALPKSHLLHEAFPV